MCAQPRKNFAPFWMRYAEPDTYDDLRLLIDYNYWARATGCSTP
jgi:hypothetical protein